VLERPPGDQRHVEPGWWETYDQEGNRIGSRHLAGYYPDDMAVAPDGKHLFVLSSGRGEGDPKKPLPALEVLSLDTDGSPRRVVARLDFDPDDDPDRLVLSAKAEAAVVSLPRSNQTASIDLTDTKSPRFLARGRLSSSPLPYVSHSAGSDWIMMPVASNCAAVAIERPGERVTAAEAGEAPPIHQPDYLICALQDESVLEILQTSPRTSLGRLPVHGPFNLGRARPIGLAYAPQLSLLAVATRSGAVHLVELRPRVGDPSGVRPRVAARPDPAPAR
jgi:glycerol-3-phosphate acyltransferase PlsY